MTSGRFLLLYPLLKRKKEQSVKEERSEMCTMDDGGKELVFTAFWVIFIHLTNELDAPPSSLSMLWAPPVASRWLNGGLCV